MREFACFVIDAGVSDAVEEDFGSALPPTTAARLDAVGVSRLPPADFDLWA